MSAQARAAKREAVQNKCGLPAVVQNRLIAHAHSDRLPVNRTAVPPAVPSAFVAMGKKITRAENVFLSRRRIYFAARRMGACDR
jgi:hypothetical protein